MSDRNIPTEQRGMFMFWLSCFLGEYRWFRRWYGGKWSRWEVNLNLTTNPLWVQGWERAGCGLAWYAREDWSTSPPAKTKRGYLGSTPWGDIDDGP